jgi:hypothetical protein
VGHNQHTGQLTHWDTKLVPGLHFPAVRKGEPWYGPLHTISIHEAVVFSRWCSSGSNIRDITQTLPALFCKIGNLFKLKLKRKTSDIMDVLSYCSSYKVTGRELLGCETNCI